MVAVGMELHGELHPLDQVLRGAADHGADDRAALGQVDDGHRVRHLELGRLGRQTIVQL